MTRALLLSLLLLLPWSAEAGSKRALEAQVRQQLETLRSPLGALAVHSPVQLSRHVPGVIIIQEPAAGGPEEATPDYTESYDDTSTASTCDELNGIDIGTRDCEASGTGGTPDGTDVCDLGPAAATHACGNNTAWANNTDGAGGTDDDIFWLSFCAQEITGASGSVTRIWRGRSGSTNQEFHLYSIGSSNTLRVGCSTTTDDTSAGIYTDDTWTRITIEVDEALHKMDLWVDKNTTESPDASCDGSLTNEAINAYFHVVEGATESGQEWEFDEFDAYYSDPVNTGTCS